SSEESDAARREAIHWTVATIESHPATGVGFADALETHDVYLQLLVSGGPLALFGFLIFAGVSLAPLRRSGQRNHLAAQSLVCLGLASSYAGFLGAALFQ